MDPQDNIQLPIIAVNMITTCILMSVQPQEQNHSSKGDETRDATVHPQGTSRQRKMSTLGKKHSLLAQDDI